MLIFDKTVDYALSILLVESHFNAVTLTRMETSDARVIMF